MVLKPGRKRKSPPIKYTQLPALIDDYVSYQLNHQNVQHSLFQQSIVIYSTSRVAPTETQNADIRVNEISQKTTKHHHPMTLTKYQRGDAIEGWNDCPSPMSLSKNSSQVSLSGDEVRQKRQDLLALLGNVFDLPLSLPEREMAHYRIKLQNQIQVVNEQHLPFIESIFNDLLNAQADSSKLKSDVVDYMMNHDGVSSWCSPLKKIVSSYKNS